ncbi:transposase family protein [Streptomyces bobili]|uniref:transposase family protein n=1 Tax=Streptomyces bobili TaxID=67280 RepID=UPI003702E9F9
MTNTEEHAEDTRQLVYQCRLPLSTRTVNHLANLLRRHLKAIRSRWRILPPGKIAVIVLALLRHDQRLADMAGGNDVSESTVRRWRDELIGLLAAQAPRLDRALKKISRQGGETVLIDGTLIRTQRRTGKADRRNYSGKHHSLGLHFLALTDEKGRLIWISAAWPGRTHDNTAARHDHILASARRRPRSAGRPRLPWPGQQPARPRDRHRLHRHPHPQAHSRGEGGQPRPRCGTCTG